VFYPVKVEASKNKGKVSGREAHAKYDVSIQMISTHAYETGKSHLRNASAIMFHCAVFRRGDPVEIFIFFRDTTIFRENFGSSHAIADPK
jgi:hypothetical protein